jgi:hypothetical protein
MFAMRRGPQDAAKKTAGRGHGWPGVDEERQDAAQKNSRQGP